MAWSSEERQRFLGVLDDVDRVVVGVYRLLLALIIVAILVGTVFVIVRRPWGAGNQGEWFYFTIAVLIALSWAGGQFISLGRRQTRRSPELAMNFDSTNRKPGTWEFRFGSRPDEASTNSLAGGDGIQFNLSQEFRLPLASVPAGMVLDEETLRRMESRIATGATVEEACRFFQPAFNGWSGMQRWAYTKLVETQLEQRRTAVDR